MFLCKNNGFKLIFFLVKSLVQEVRDQFEKQFIESNNN